MVEGLRIEFSDGRDTPTTLEGINRQLRKVGAGVWPLDLGDQPADIQQLISQPVLNEEDAQRVKERLLLPRGRLLEIIGDAGRSPQVPGGGELSTYVVNYDYRYPQLYVVEEGIDYSRFDRFHVNVAADGTGVDEVLQMLCGSGLQIHQRLEGTDTLTLTLDCPAPGQGWLATYNGVHPHIGSVASAAPGSKFLVQVIGAPEWIMQYVDVESYPHET